MRSAKVTLREIRWQMKRFVENSSYLGLTQVKEFGQAYPSGFIEGIWRLVPYEHIKLNMIKLKDVSHSCLRKFIMKM